MKLRYFDVERFGTWNNAKLDGLEDGLTVIHGPNGSGKTTLMQFVRAVFYGRAEQGSHRFLPAVHPGSQGGRVGVTQQGREFIVNRFWETNAGADDATVTSADGTIHDSVELRRLLGEVDESVFNALYTVGYREAEDFDLIVREALNDKESRMLASDELAAVNRAIATVDGKRDRLGELQGEKVRLREEISRLTVERINPPSELVQVRENIDRLETLIRELQARISELEVEISRCGTVTVRPEVGINSAGERVKRLEKQIANWRNWQREIDEQLAAVRNQLHHAALRDCDPVDRSPKAQMLRTRGSMTVIENQLSDLQTRFDSVRKGEHANGDSIQADLTDLRDRVFNLCDQLGQHEVLDEIAMLEAESVQLQRCRSEIDRQLSIMIQRRRILLHEYSNGVPESFRRHSHSERLTCQSHAHDRWLTEPEVHVPAVNHNLEALVAERDRLVHELNQARQQLAEQGQRRIELERALRDTDLARRLESLRLDLNIVEEELRREMEEKDVRVTTRTLLHELKDDYESRRQSVVLAEASEFLRRLCGERCELIESSDGRSLAVHRAMGDARSITALSRGERDQVGLCLRLALARAHTRRGTRLPLILDDVFITSDSESAEATAALLRDFAADNQQVLFFTCHEHIARMFRNLGVTVRDLPRATAVPEQRQPRPIVTKVVAEPRDPIQLTPVVTAPWVDLPPNPESLVVKAFRSEEEELKDVAVQTSIDFEPTENWIFYTELTTTVDELYGVTAEQVEGLASSGVHTVEDLLALLPDNAAMQLSHLGLTTDQIRSWQSQALLSCRVPMLRRQDAALLVRCGLTTPEQLADDHPNDVYDRVFDYLNTTEGSRFIRASNPFDRQTAINWVRWAAHARTLWHSRERNAQPQSQYQTATSSRSTGDGSGRPTTSSNGDGNGSSRAERSSSSSSSGGSGTSTRTRTGSRSGVATRSTRTSRSKRSSSRTSSRSKTRRSLAKTPSALATRERRLDEGDRPLRFFLQREAPVEDAPSIGPKTAEHLAKVDIITVRDLLDADAEAAATELGHKRIKARTIEEWQAQAILVCRVPELRGHDSQILVACDVTSPEELAAFRPADLFAKVAPFVDTPEGERIVRSGKKPDLEEITYWIECANQARALRAA